MTFCFVAHDGQYVPLNGRAYVLKDIALCAVMGGVHCWSAAFVVG
jgi:hypothetical protein